jgi:hypothetical protein
MYGFIWFKIAHFAPNFLVEEPELDVVPRTHSRIPAGRTFSSLRPF